MNELEALGFDQFFSEQLSDESEFPARVAAEHRGGYEVWSKTGTAFAKTAGCFSRNLDVFGFPSVGDWVVLDAPVEQGAISVIRRVLRRRTVFSRGAAGRESRGQIVASNIDVVFAVNGLDADYNIRRTERYLARIWASGANPVVVLNKADISDDLEDRVSMMKASCFGVPVISTSALHSIGMDEIVRYIGPGTTAAFVGSSGAGKSTLINSLLGEKRMTTKETSSRDGRGMHTTTHRQLLVLPQGGLLLDTPGMKELQLFDEDGLESVFPDIGELAINCKFKDCGHESEPGCAVKEAVASGSVPKERLEHYLKLKAEAADFEIRSDQRLRRKADRDLGRRMSKNAESLKRLRGDKFRIS